MIQNKNFRWGQLIKEIREEKGLTKKELSELSGVPATTIGEIENVRNKNRGSNIHIIDKILIALGYELEAIALDPEPIKFCGAKEARYQRWKDTFYKSHFQTHRDKNK